MTDTTFNIELTRSDGHGNDHAATITFPNDETHTISCHNPKRLLNDVRAVLSAYNGNDPDTFTDRLSTDPTQRRELAIDCLEAYDGCLEVLYWEYEQEIVAFLQITSTDPIEELPFFCDLDERYTAIDFTREHGLHLRVHWRINNYGMNLDFYDDYDRDEFVQRYREKTLNEYETIESLLIKRNEYITDTPDVVTNDAISDNARIAGTDNTAVHIAWRLEDGDTRDDLTGVGYGTLTDDDIDAALEYAENNPEEYEEYVQEREEFREQLENTANDDFVPLDPDEDDTDE